MTEACTDPEYPCHGNPHLCNQPGWPEKAGDTWTCPACGLLWTGTQAQEVRWLKRLVEKGSIPSNTLTWVSHRPANA